MSTNLVRNEPSRHVTFNIITDKTTRFVSVTAMHRQPSEVEKRGADWFEVLRRGAFFIHVVGRGDKLTTETLQGLARTYVDGGSSIWVHVDLSALERNECPIVPIAIEEKPATWMDSDPVWKRIVEINEGRK